MIMIQLTIWSSDTKIAYQYDVFFFISNMSYSHFNKLSLIFSFEYRFGAKTMGASMAQSRLKTIEKLETSGIEAPKVRKLYIV